jgi:hypothetical protein
LPRSETIVLAATLVISDSFIRGLYCGQLGALTAFLLLAALDAQARGRPILAGACLALATIKVVTMLPFLVLFYRKADRAAWISMICVGLGLCLATGRPAQLPVRLASLRDRIEILAAPGKVNDYSFEGTQDESLIGFDRLFYCLGLRDRVLIRRLQYLSVAALGLWVGREVLFGRRSRGVACSLVALFSMVFLYHRDYDCLVLALPLVYCARRAQVVSGAARRLFLSCAVSLFAPIFMNMSILVFLENESQRWEIWGRPIQAVLLPYATWSVLLVMVGLVTADSLARRSSKVECASGCGHGALCGAPSA